MKAIKKILMLIAAAAIALSACCLPVSALDDVRVKLVSSAAEVSPGDRFMVSLCFENAAEYKYGLCAFMNMITYDKTKIKFVKISFDETVKNESCRAFNSEVRTLYYYASVNHDPGFNKNGAFLTITFEVLDDASGTIELAADFDTILTCDYDVPSDIGVENINLGYNTPSLSIPVSGSGESLSDSAQTSDDGSVTVSSGSASDASGQHNDTSNQVGNIEIKNPDFVQATGGSEYSDEIITDGDALVSFSDSYASSKGDALSNKDSLSESDKSLTTVFIVFGVILLIAAAVVVTVLIIQKNKNSDNK